MLAKPATPADEPAPSDILQSVEKMHQMAWTLQASPVDAETCANIAQQAAAIYAHSVSQAAQSKRATDVAASLATALTKLDGLLQTITLEAEADVAAHAS